MIYTHICKKNQMCPAPPPKQPKQNFNFTMRLRIQATTMPSGLHQANNTMQWKRRTTTHQKPQCTRLPQGSSSNPEHSNPVPAVVTATTRSGERGWSFGSLVASLAGVPIWPRRMFLSVPSIPNHLILFSTYVLMNKCNLKYISWNKCKPGKVSRSDPQ